MFARELLLLMACYLCLCADCSLDRTDIEHINQRVNGAVKKTKEMYEKVTHITDDLPRIKERAKLALTSTESYMWKAEDYEKEAEQEAENKPNSLKAKKAVESARKASDKAKQQAEKAKSKKELLFELSNQARSEYDDVYSSYIELENKKNKFDQIYEDSEKTQHYDEVIGCVETVESKLDAINGILRRIEKALKETETAEKEAKKYCDIARAARSKAIKSVDDHPRETFSTKKKTKSEDPEDLEDLEDPEDNDFAKNITRDTIKKNTTNITDDFCILTFPTGAITALFFSFLAFVA